MFQTSIQYFQAEHGHEDLPLKGIQTSIQLLRSSFLTLVLVKSCSASTYRLNADMKISHCKDSNINSVSKKDLPGICFAKLMFAQYFQAKRGHENFSLKCFKRQYSTSKLNADIKISNSRDSNINSITQKVLPDNRFVKLIFAQYFQAKRGHKNFSLK